MNELDPKPPELLQKIEWLRLFWRKHPWPLLMAAIFLVVAAVSTKVDWGSLLPQAKESSTAALMPNQDNKNESSPHKNQEPALRVTFNDGSSAYVSLSMQFQLNQSRVIDSFSRFGSAEAAIASLRQAVRGATFNVLEAYSQSYVRSNRQLVAQQIKDQTQDAQRLSAYDIVELNIMEIEGGS